MAEAKKSVAEYKPKHAAPSNRAPVGKKPELEKPASKPGRITTIRNSKTVQTTKKVGKKAYTGSFDSKFAPRQKPIKSVVTYRHMIAAEFWLGLILILGQSWEDQTEKNPENRAESPIVQSAAFILFMAILFGITGMGARAARFAAALGGLVTLTIAISSTGQVQKHFGGLDLHSKKSLPPIKDPTVGPTPSESNPSDSGAGPVIK